MKKQPNLFFIGAMRSGSTTLHMLLDQHPQIFMSPRKEPMFYVAEEMRRRLQKSEDMDIELNNRLSEFVSRGRCREQCSYEELFAESNNEKYLGESSHYLYAPQVAKTIYDDCPTARILISLRNPVDCLYSEYLYYRRTNQRSGNFDEFVREGCLFDDEGVLQDIGPHSRISKGFYAKLVKPWLDIFGPEQVKVILFEALTRKPVQEVQLVYEWLGVDAEFEPVPVHAQQGGIPRFRKLLSLLNAKGPVKRIAKKMLPKMIREQLRSRIYSVSLHKEPIEPETASFLKQVYLPDIEELELLLQLELAEWK